MAVLPPAEADPKLAAAIAEARATAPDGRERWAEGGGDWAEKPPRYRVEVDARGEETTSLGGRDAGRSPLRTGFRRVGARRPHPGPPGPDQHKALEGFTGGEASGFTRIGFKQQQLDLRAPGSRGLDRLHA